MAAPDPPIFTRDAIREVDRAAIEDYGIPGIVLMENAARGVAEHVADMVKSITDRPPRIGIVCGAGNNGGDGYAAARHLHNRGMEVTIVAIGEPKPESDAGINAAVCLKMGLAVRSAGAPRSGSAGAPRSGSAGVPPAANVSAIRSPLSDSNLFIDAIFGTGLAREVGQPHRELIEWMNASDIPILAVDCPSGMDCETGEVFGSCVMATRTVTFVGWKVGFLNDAAKPNIGEIHLVDIGAPRELVERLRRPGP